MPVVKIPYGKLIFQGFKIPNDTSSLVCNVHSHNSYTRINWEKSTQLWQIQVIHQQSFITMISVQLSEMNDV